MRLGVNLPQYSIDFESGALSVDAAVGFAVEAERAGVDSVWASDHPFVVGPDGISYPAIDPIELLEAVAAATDRVRVGTLVLAAARRGEDGIVDATRRLGRAAQDRVIVGLGTGWYEPEFPDGVPPVAERVAVLEDCARAAAREADVLIGGSGRRVLDIAARFARMWNLAWDQTHHAFAEASAALDRACEETGRDGRMLDRSIGLTVAVGGLEDQVARVRRRAAFLGDLDPVLLARQIVTGDADAVAQRLHAYGADEVIVTPFVRDDPSSLRALVRAVVG